jgi:hypothetical protein
MKTVLNLIRWLLYGVAIATGVLGLIAGGDPIVRYLMDELRNYEYRDYYEATNYLQEPEIIFLLSLILLIGVRIAMALERVARHSNPVEMPQPEKKPVAATATGETSQPSAAAEAFATPAETVDEKLAHLLHRDKH